MLFRRIKEARVCLAVIFMALLTMAILDAGFGVTNLGKWLMEAQLVPAIIGGGVLWVILWVVVTLVFGRFYCSTVCPLGTLQDCAAHLGRRFARGAGRRYRYSRPYDIVRLIIPLVVAASLFAGFTSLAVYTDPYYTYAHAVNAVARPAAIGFGSAAVAIAVVIVIMAVAWWRGRLVCNTVCPAGSLLGLLGRQPVYRIDINTDLCIHCDKCVDVCKASCIKMPDCTVDNSRCVRCMNCTSVCPNSAITLRRGRHRLSTPLLQSTGER